jgi:outer membrane protein assembly factor BamB
MLLPALALAVAVAPETWPQFRGPNGDGVYAGSLPTKWGETENVRWKSPVRGKGWSSPVVWGGRVWVTTANDDGTGKAVLGYDRATGKLETEVPLFAGVKPVFAHAFNSHASPTPAVEGDRLYAHFGSVGTACIDTATGAVVWQRTDLPCDHWRGPASSPTVYGDRLFLIFDGYDRQYVVALNKSDGTTAWQKDRNIKYSRDDGDIKKAYATPAPLAVNGKVELVCPSAEQTVAYDPATGDELWRVSHGGMNGSARAVAGHGLLFLTSGHNANLLAVRQGQTGTVGKDGVAWKLPKDVPTRPSLLLVGDHIFMVDDKGMASCVEAKTGKVNWKERVGGEYSASPLAAGRHVYLFDQDGRTHVLAATPTYTPVGTNRLAAGFMASPAAADGKLYLRTKTHLYCVGE